MNEDFLSFVWRYQYFEASDLRSESGELVRILQPGQHNTNAGPDFTNARVVIDEVEWAGCVEMHVYSSDWQQHRHAQDAAYESVVLHVVWEDDRPVRRDDGTLLPTLSLKGRVAGPVRERYEQLMNQTDPIPCAPQFGEVAAIRKLSMLDRVLLERLDKKADLVLSLWEMNGRDWEETTYQWLAQHFGFKLNAPPFLRLAQQLPLKTLQKHRDNSLQIEALLFGTAGLLPETTTNDYVLILKQEYKFLAAKYRLKGKGPGLHEWKFMRLRPAGFPTVRLAQLAVLIQQQSGLFAALCSAPDVAILRKMFRVTQSDYWREHYHFGKVAKGKVPALGADAADLLIINVAVPLLTAYARQRDQPALLDKALAWLEQLPAENNHLTRQWEELGMRVKTSADSQALIEWYNHYCSAKRCLECTVGLALLRSA
ncbi:DUF2851 family protein [Telluribacter sp.]|jgi:hypothetical protein|uniref:DUF2851 family protein n=1 Tax=Telluribacter sp. TaxID=1978767 RepID=UPI002E12035E|nr:DUF2851 family protein [Telluribacter sp.]